MIAREPLGFLTALLLLLTPVSLLAQTPMSSPESFPDMADTEAAHPDTASDERQQFVRDVFHHLERKLRSRFRITFRQPRNRLNHPPDPDRFSDSRSNNVLYGYYLPRGTNPYGFFVGCTEPDPDRCETIDLSQWQNSNERFRYSADGISDRIIGDLYENGSEEESESSFSLLSLLGLSSASDSRAIRVKLTNTGDTPVSDTSVMTSALDDDPVGQPAVFSNPPGTTETTSSLRSTNMEQEAAINEIILLISSEKFRAAKNRLDQLDPDVRNHPRLKNLVQQLKQLTRLSTDNSGR